MKRDLTETEMEGNEAFSEEEEGRFFFWSERSCDLLPKAQAK